MAPQTFQLVMRTGPTPGKIYGLGTGEVTIGRDISSDIVINDAEVSRRHVRLRMDAGGFVVEDIGSTNGTFVNGQRLMGPHLLRSGELILLGENVGLIFEAVQFDPDATIAASNIPSLPQMPVGYAPEPAYPPAPAAYSPAPPPQPDYIRQADYARQAPAPAYGAPGQAQAPQAYEYPEDDDRKNRRTWVYVGCGCLLVLLCVVVAAGAAFDQLNLYCSGPFRSLGGLLWTCP